MARIQLNQRAVRTFGQRNAAIAVRTVQKQTEFGSKRMARRSPAHLRGDRKPAPGPRLTESIRSSPVKITVFGAEGTVGAYVRYAMTEHEGSKAHRIRAKGRKLRFYWTKRYSTDVRRTRIRPGRASYFESVWHPGNRKPVKYLTTPLQVAARTNGFVYRRF